METLSNIICQLFGPYANSSNISPEIKKVSNNNFDLYFKGKSVLLFVDKRDESKRIVYPNAPTALFHVRNFTECNVAAI